MARPRLLASTCLALSLSVAGCAGIQTTDAPIATGSHGEALTFFESAHASLTIQIVDNRPYTTESIYYADTYNWLQFTLTNETKLKAPLVKGVTHTGSRTYTAVFTGLPSDPELRYALAVGLYRSTMPESLTDAAATALDHKVGEGISANFSLTPGQNRTIVIAVNAVGELSFTSDRYLISDTDPTFVSGDASVVVRSTNLMVNRNPGATEFKVFLLDGNGDLVANSVATASVPANSEATASVKVPTVGLTTQNYTVVADLLGGNTVLSRRKRTIHVEPGATLSGNTEG